MIAIAHPTAIELLAELDRLGVSVAVKGDRIGLRPATRVPPELLEIIRSCRSQMMDLLSGPRQTPTPRMLPADLPADWHFLWDERAAITAYDGGLTREHAEAAALADILARMQELEKT